MYRAFTLIELTICIAIVSIILLIIIRMSLDANEKNKNKVHEVTIGFRDLVGKTFIWNGNKTLIVDYNDDCRYVVVIMPTNNGAVNVTADRRVIMEAYKASLELPVMAEKAEKVEK